MGMKERPDNCPGALETVKKPADMKDDRAAGELEGARPASS